MEVSMVALIVSVAFIVLALVSFIKTQMTIGKYRQLFPMEPEQIGFQKTPTVQILYDEKDDFRARIVRPTNKYLLNNHGSVSDFGVLSDFAELENTALEKLIMNRLGMPVYLGLIGTMVGIALSFWLTNSTFDTQTSLTLFLNHVKWAMTCSACGLAMTTISSRTFRMAKAESDRRKGLYFNLLKGEILPVSGKDLTDSLATLRVTLENFNPQFTKNVEEFGQGMERVYSVLNLERDLVNRLEELNLKKIEKILDANLALFDKFGRAGVIFDQLLDKQTSINNSLDRTGEAAARITELLDRFSDFEDAVRSTSSNLMSQDTSANDLIRSLKEKSASLIDRYDLIKQHVGKVDGEIDSYVSNSTAAVSSLLQKITDKIKDSFGEKELLYFEHLPRLKKIEEQSKSILDATTVSADVMRKSLQPLSEQIMELSKVTEGLNIAIMSLNDRLAEKRGFLQKLRGL